MKRLLLLPLLFLLCMPVSAIEIEQPKAVQSIHHVIPIDDDEETIDNKVEQKYDDLYFPNEVELKGSVIYNESLQHAKEIELDKTVEKPQVNLKTKHMIIPVRDEKIYSTGIDISQRSPLSTATRVTGEEYSVKPIWSYINEQAGNFSYGTIYSSSIDTCQLQSTMNLYTRYDFKYFAIMGAVGTNESNVEGTRDEKTIQISPELKLSKSFVIRDTIQAYVNENYKKNKISIIYTPQWKKYPDMLRFELGLSHTYYTGGRIRSAVEFSTKIRL